MSILIKGIDMPKDDDFISLEIHKGEYRIYFVKGATIREKRGEAIQIPTPHGRLIDEDEIYEQPHCGECNDATLDAINNAPTILEAED